MQRDVGRRGGKAFVAARKKEGAGGKRFVYGKGGGLIKDPRGGKTVGGGPKKAPFTCKKRARKGKGRGGKFSVGGGGGGGGRKGISRSCERGKRACVLRCCR